MPLMHIATVIRHIWRDVSANERKSWQGGSERLIRTARQGEAN